MMPQHNTPRAHTSRAGPLQLRDCRLHGLLAASARQQARLATAAQHLRRRQWGGRRALWQSSKDAGESESSVRRLQHNQSPPSLALWYSSTAPLRCAATSAVPSVPGSQASATQREALLLPSGLKDSEVTGRVEVGGARSCARSDSSTTASRGAAEGTCRQGEAELQMSKPSLLRLTAGSDNQNNRSSLTFPC